MTTTTLTIGTVSWFLASMYTQLVAQGTAAVIDPHGDLAHDCMAILIDLGKRDQVRFVDFSDTKRYVPWNVLRNPRRPVCKLTRGVLQARERAWPALGCLTSTPSGAGIRSGSRPRRNS